MPMIRSGKELPCQYFLLTSGNLLGIDNHKAHKVVVFSSVCTRENLFRSKITLVVAHTTMFSASST